MADCIRPTLAARARFERRRLLRKRGNGSRRRADAIRLLCVAARLMATPSNRVRTTDKAVKRLQSLTPQTIALCVPINGRRSGDAKMADCIRLTLAAGARFERRRLSRKRGNGRMMCLPIGRVLTVLAVACAVLV